MSRRIFQRRNIALRHWNSTRAQSIPLPSFFPFFSFFLLIYRVALRFLFFSFRSISFYHPYFPSFFFFPFPILLRSIFFFSFFTLILLFSYFFLRFFPYLSICSSIFILFAILVISSFPSTTSYPLLIVISSPFSFPLYTFHYNTVQFETRDASY